MLGLHPAAKRARVAVASPCVSRTARPAVVAIRERALAYPSMHSPRETQIAVFERHLDLAKRVGKPIIVHNRESAADMVRILAGSGARGILHSFTESEEIARTFIDAGYYISFSGIVTFRTAEPLRACAKALPHDRVLIETDTPFLAPVPYRGRDNEPAYVIKVAELLATLWGIPVEEVAAITTANFENVFGVTLRG